MDIKLLRHIFCLPCADTLGLSHPTHGERRCPACQTILVNPDDAASTVLNPSEDYKTSVLSGLDPNTIMECASRALVFWAYQATQEMCVLPIFPIDFCINFLTGDRFYQEYLGKSLTEKYSTLNTHMDRVIHNANAEISALQAKLNSSSSSADPWKRTGPVNSKYRHASNRRAASQEEPGTCQSLQREVQEVRSDHQFVQHSQVSCYEVANEDRCVRHCLANFGLTRQLSKRAISIRFEQANGHIAAATNSGVSSRQSASCQPGRGGTVTPASAERNWKLKKHEAKG